MANPSDALSEVQTSTLDPSLAQDGFRRVRLRLYVRVRGDLAQHIELQKANGRFYVNFATANFAVPGFSFDGWQGVGGRFSRHGFPEGLDRSGHLWESGTREHAERSISEVLTVYHGHAREWFERTASTSKFLDELATALRSRMGCNERNNRLAAACTLIRLGRLDEARVEIDRAKDAIRRDSERRLEGFAEAKAWNAEVAARCDALRLDPFPTLESWRAENLKKLNLDNSSVA